MRVFVITCAVIFILVFIGLAALFMGSSSTIGEYKSTEEWMQYVSKGSVVYPYEMNHEALSTQYGSYKSTEYIFISDESDDLNTTEYWDIFIHYENGTDYWKGKIVFSSEYSRDAVPFKAIKSLRSNGQYFKYNN